MAKKLKKVNILKKKKNVKNVPRMDAKPKDTRAFTKCSSCGKKVYFGQYPFCPHGDVPSVMAQRFAPIVVFKQKDGTYSFPGRADARTPKGSVRVEITNVHQARKFESEVNHHESMKHEQSAERSARSFGAIKDQFRGELRQRMQSFSPLGRDLAMLAMKNNDDKPRRAYDPGFRIDVLSNDSSNREVYRDKETDWRRRKG